MPEENTEENIETEEATFEVKEIVTENVDSKTKAVDNIKDELDRLNDEKEKWFAEKEKISTKIRENIREIRELKKKRDTFTAAVRQNKALRTDSDEKLKEIMGRLSILKTERDTIYKKHNLTGSPELLQTQMKKLEKKIETEVMSFDNEKKLMKTIRTLRERLKEYDIVSEINLKIKDVNKEFRDVKRIARDISGKIKEDAAHSQVEHNLMLEKSKEIDVLKPQEEEAFKNFSELKTKYLELSAQLKEKFTDLSSARKELKKTKEKAKKKRDEEQKKSLEEKHEEVEKKIKQGKKLTTEDLLAFQGMD